MKLRSAAAAQRIYTDSMLLSMVSTAKAYSILYDKFDIFLDISSLIVQLYSHLQVPLKYVCS